VNVGVIGRNGMCNVLHHDRFARLWLRHDEGTLTFANGGNDVNDAAGDVFIGLDITL
jgi:hypothetical protein